MLRRCALALTLVLAGAVSPSLAQVSLGWKLKDGDKFFVETTTTLSQTLKLTDREVKQEIETTSMMAFTVRKRNDDGSLVLEQMVESLDFRAKSGVPQPVDERFARVKGSAFEVSISPTGEVTKFAGFDEVVKKVVGEDASAQRLARIALQEDAFRRIPATLFGVVPTKKVNKGDKWEHKSTVTQGLLGTLTITSQCSYVGTDALGDKQRDKVECTGTATFTPTTSAPSLPFSISKAELKADEIKGTFYIDSNAGRVVQGEQKVHLKGPVTFAIGGATHQTEVDQTQTIKMQVLDKNPAAAPAPAAGTPPTAPGAPK